VADASAPIPTRPPLSGSRRLVVKLGSALLAPAGRLDPAAVARLAADIADVARTREVCIVSSGAVASGFRLLGLDRPPKTIVGKQAAAAVGQSLLMRAWAEAFAPLNRNVAQVLLTADDLDHRTRLLNARRTLAELLAHSILPIINENDSVAFDEIKLGDNDRLSALVAAAIGADLLVILSSVRGLFEAGDPARVIPLVRDPAAAALHVRPGTSDVGTGGMTTKLQAAAIAGDAGIPTVIAGGNDDRVLARLLAGESTGTYIQPAPRRRAARKGWIGHSTRVRGSLVVDAGARAAIESRGASLLPSGILAVEGDFISGAAVDIRTDDAPPFARGIAAYAADELRRLRGKRSDQIEPTLGYAYSDEAIHRDDLVILRPAPAREAAPKRQ